MHRKLLSRRLLIVEVGFGFFALGFPVLLPFFCLVLIRV